MFVSIPPPFAPVVEKVTQTIPVTKSTESTLETEATVDNLFEEESEKWLDDGWLFCISRWALWTVVCVIVTFFFLKLLILWNTRRQMKNLGFVGLSYRPVVVGFFHPYCAAGGGGERVLWHSIQALQRRYSFIRCVVYTGDVTRTPQEILNTVQIRFQLQLREVKFIYLKRRGWVESVRWPRLTILGQSIGSMILGLEAVLKLAPHVYMETTGYAFTLPIFRWLGGCRTASYVHYPTVSSDMLMSVAKHTHSFNNSSSVSNSKILTKLKLLYYRLFACLYGFMGRHSDVVMVNSSWTHSHICQLWSPRQLFIVYPPCDTASFNKLPLRRSSQPFRVVSLGQFRPEKNHAAQLRILHELVMDYSNITLVLIGGCRNSDDQQRVNDLRHLAKELKVSKHVEFKVNLKFSEMKEELGRAVAALHTMENEHFGISVVECMSAGCVMVAHESGGPQQDIVVNWEGQPTGYLAASEDQFVSCLIEIINMTDTERNDMTKRARIAVQTKFSVEVFEASFLRASEKLFG